MPHSTKTCSMCGGAKPFHDFHRNARAKDGRQSRCKDCSRETLRDWQGRNRVHATLAVAQWRESNREAVRDHKRKHKYGLTGDDYRRMLAGQEGACAICGVVMEPPCVDHCHTSGRVRGLLCSSCNVGIGHLRDNPEILDAAARYLRAQR